MRIERLRLFCPQIPFKSAFRHASAERSETSSLWVEARSSGELVGYGESCPRPYVTGESIETARAFFGRHESAIRARIDSLAALKVWAESHAEEINANPAAWCAIELALLDLLAREAGQPVEALLGRPPIKGPFQYTAILGDAEADAFAAMASRYAAMGFTDFKIKLSGDPTADRAKLDAVRKAVPGLSRIRVDANNVWADADRAIAAVHALNGGLAAVEEPIAPNRYDALNAIAEALGCPIVLDESFLRLEQLDHLRAAPGRWIINVRVSKMGGLLRSLAIVDAATVLGIGIIVGAQVGESSLLTRAALPVADAAGASLVAQEGAFGTFLLERDVCEPTLMFGHGGRLDLAAYPSLSAAPGFGLATLHTGAAG